MVYNKTYVKRPLKIDKAYVLMTNGSLMIDCVFCNAFDLHKAIIGLEKQVSVFLRVAGLHRLYCIFYSGTWSAQTPGYHQ